MRKRAIRSLTKSFLNCIFIEDHHFYSGGNVMCRKVFSSIAALVCLSAVSAENLVPNGGFDNNTLAGWSINSRPVSIKTYTVKDGILHGEYADGIKQKDFVAATAQLPKLEAGNKYEFGAKVKINAAPKA